ncbi:hypothetical protein [Dehalococcoides mccartyi]|jgi:hypothetical protein
MIIQKQYIRNIDLYLDASYQDKTLIFGFKIENLIDGSVKRLGFRGTPSVGDGILPNIAGPVSRFNAEGKWIVHRDQPMETAHREVMWHWQEWRGRDDTEEKSDVRDVEYKRYPRTFVPPPSIELKISATGSGQLAVVSPATTLMGETSAQVKHIINLLLEFFDYCEVFNESLDEMAAAPLRRLNWRLLPPGEYPWPRLKEQIQELIERTGKGKQEVLQYRLEAINSYGPEFRAIGEGGFRGYIAFGFPDKRVYCFESMYTGNATYVFSDDWVTLSKLTKAEILNEHLQKDRLIHIAGWADKVHSLLAP